MELDGVSSFEAFPPPRVGWRQVKAMMDIDSDTNGGPARRDISIGR